MLANIGQVTQLRTTTGASDAAPGTASDLRMLNPGVIERFLDAADSKGATSARSFGPRHPNATDGVRYSRNVIAKGRRAAGPAGQRRRRPTDPTRRRDPERTRQAILDAASEEFATHGLDGARVVRIAAAAGVNHQLITYHFGGKQGLYNAVAERWLTKGSIMITSTEPLAEIVREYVRWPHEDKVATMRTLVRAELDGERAPADEQAARLLSIVEES